MISKYFKLEKQFFNFLRVTGSLCCGRCYMIRHHECTFNTVLKSIKKIDDSFVDNWFKDTEHGYFHCLMVSFISYYYDQNVFENRKLDFDNIDFKSNDIHHMNQHMVKYLSSGLLHDFLKCNGYKQEEHDTRLREYFPLLMEETYQHSNPSPEYDHSLMIIGDRTELRRYPDYDEWVDKSVLKHEILLNKENKEILDIFYNVLRPSLLYLFENRQKVFVRHGIENIHNTSISDKYPFANSYSDVKEHTCYYKKKQEVLVSDVKDSDLYYPIETGKLPFADYYWKDSEEIHGSNCINHDKHHNWNMLKGVISLQDLKKNGGKIVSTNHRDHLYAESNIDTDKWVFIHKVHYNHFEGIPRYRIKAFDKTSYNEHISKMLEKGLGLVSQRVINEFFKVMDLLDVKMRSLN